MMQRKSEEVKLGAAAVTLSADLSRLRSGGGAEQEVALAKLQKQLMCPICEEIFKKPVVILPCQHNLCRKCANELYQPSLFQPRTTMLVNSGRFRCPSCRHDVVLDRHGVYGLQRNLLVENIIDIYRQEVQNNDDSSSGGSSAPSPAPLPPGHVTCADHQEEKVNIYCLTCGTPTCSLCKVFGAHQDCRVAPLTDVCQQQKDQLSEGLASLEAFNDKIQTLMDELEQSCRNIEENARTQKQLVCDSFNRIFSILKERQKAMTQQITSEEEEKTGHAQGLLSCYGDSVMANNKLVEIAVSSMEEPDMVAFVQNFRELISRVTVAVSSCPSETLRPGYENLSCYRFNFREQEGAVRSIDFIRAVDNVLEEPEPDQEPEEPSEPSLQNTEPKSSVEDPEVAVEPDKQITIPPVEPEPTAQTPPVEPEPTAQTPPVEPILLKDCEGPAVGPGGLHSNSIRSGQNKAEQEPEEPGEPEQSPTVIKEEGKQQEGMSTVQVVTLVFYLFTFLVFLQRAWSYICCFIGT
ncbi:tripartite motif containing 101 [Pholidichthys leucotaenia]